MKQAYFVTGTDTGVGKTYVTCKLMQHYIAQGQKVVGMKPIAAGCETINGVWQNEDVANMRALSNVDAPLEYVNPFAFDPPIAPHIAAAQANVEISLAKIHAAFDELQQRADVVLVEGAGGLLVPINAQQTTADIPLLLGLPVILVVGIRLGCINHALLTAEAIKARGLILHGWVANHIDPHMPVQQENVEAIAERLQSAPMFEFAWQG